MNETAHSPREREQIISQALALLGPTPDAVTIGDLRKVRDACKAAADLLDGGYDALPDDERGPINVGLVYWHNHHLSGSWGACAREIYSALPEERRDLRHALHLATVTRQYWCALAAQPAGGEQQVGGGGSF